MIELGFVRLDLTKVPVVEVAGVSQVYEPEDDNTAASITNSKVLSCRVETHC